MGGGGGGKGPFIYKVISDEGGSLLNILHNYKGSVCVCVCVFGEGETFQNLLLLCNI